ncbi:MAG: glycosyltransferase family 4 protein [Nakamurella sp.]
MNVATATTATPNPGAVGAASRSAGGVRGVSGSLDSPAENVVVHGNVVVVIGWVLWDGRLVSRIEVEVDGAKPVRARTTLPRIDVAAVLPDLPDAVLAGYEARVPVDIAAGESREVSVRVIAHSRAGAGQVIATRVCTVRSRAFDPQERAVVERNAAMSRQLLAGIQVPRDPDHVLVFTHSLRVGGGELWLAELIGKLLRENGIHVTVVAPADGPLRAELEGLGARVWLTGDHDVARSLPYQAYVNELALIARASGAGSVLVNTLGVFAGVDAALLAQLPVAWVIHESFALADFELLNWGADGLDPSVRRRWQDCLGAADALLFVADATRELFLRYSAPRKCLTIKYGIDVTRLDRAGSAEETSALRRRYGIDERAQVLLTVGVSEPRKGHAALVVAFERIRRHHPYAHLVIVGMIDSPYCHAVHRCVAERRLDDRVTLVPIVRDPRAYFQIADFFVNSSDIESLPRSIIEAVAFGVPVLAADVFGSRDLVVDGVTGWLFSPNDSNALTVGLARALDSSAGERELMAGRALRHIGGFLDSTHYGGQYASLMRGLAAAVPAHVDSAPGGGPS